MVVNLAKDDHLVKEGRLTAQSPGSKLGVGFESLHSLNKAPYGEKYKYYSRGKRLHIRREVQSMKGI